LPTSISRSSNSELSTILAVTSGRNNLVLLACQFLASLSVVSGNLSSWAWIALSLVGSSSVDSLVGSWANVTSAAAIWPQSSVVWANTDSTLDHGIDAAALAFTVLVQNLVG